MNLSEIYKKTEKYDFDKVDICAKDYAIASLICYIKGITMSKFYSMKTDLELNDREVELLFKYLDKLVYEKEPLQYILGTTFFYNEEYIVTEDVLIPRQDTEIAVEKAVEYINKYSLKKCLDLCCGTGAIGISICKNSNIEEVHFIDISEKALEITRKNIEKNNVNKKVKLINSDLFENIMTSPYKYDIIVSNPPYIRNNELKNLSGYVKKEPMLALDGGYDGLYFYKKIIDKARYFLNDNGYIIFEIGYDQLNYVINIFNKYKEYEITEKVKDLNSNDRVIICRFHKI